MARVTVFGGGLAGCLAAVYAAKADHDVTVVEKRADSRSAGYVGGRSINLALSRRGLHALDRVGLADAVRALGLPMAGRCMHARDASLTFQRYGRPGEANLSISRQGLNELLMDAAEQTGRVSFLFGSRASHIDLDRAVVRVEADGVSHELASDLLVGADGAFSAVRERMMHRDRFNYAQTYISHGYIELTIPPGPGGAFRIDPGALHIWPRGTFMMIALPNLDGSFTCTLFLAWDGETNSFAALADPDRGVAFLEREFPDLVPLLGDANTQWREHVPSSLVYVRCSPYATGRTVLIGDAAHAVVPFYGQGMNAAFEDCRLLFEQLGTSPDSWPQDCAGYATARKPDADAISELALANFHEMRAHVADPAFLLRKELEHVLSDFFPESYRSLYELVTYTDVPYSETQRLAHETDALLDNDEARLGLLTLAFCRWLGGVSPAPPTLG